MKSLTQSASYIEYEKVNVPLKNNLFEDTESRGEEGINELDSPGHVIDVV